MKKQNTSARLLIMTTGSLPPSFFSNWTSSGVYLLLIALPLTTTYRKVPKYFSRFWNPRTAGVDAFSQNWQYENCLVVPPIVLLSKVLIFMFLCNARGTLLVPYWPSASFWPLLVHKFGNFVVDYSFFEGRLALRLGRNTNSFLSSASWDGLVLAVKV